ncbi:MAG: 50S ribosomal protein L11 methyltransferase [Muribaculaceae bacterium]|nr:50S ribosomal protein L11 methyltransferase [Muribaculaceae bacterium]
MNDYYEVRVNLDPCTEDATDYLAAVLGDIGFESFVPDNTGLTAYIQKDLYSKEEIDISLEDFPFEGVRSVETKFVEGQDWNAEWEKNYFKPIIVGDQCVIHSSFHTDIPRVKYDIVIDPKMAFGTGHHATTSLIISRLLQADLEGKSVIDMGTGTGILAILAAMRGAEPVYGIEIDGFAYDNAVENTKLNNHSEITLINSDASALERLPSVDVFIANINRNVITADIDKYAAHLKSGGVMLLSGFYEHDIPVVMEAAARYGLSAAGHEVKGDNWTCLKLVKD